MSIGAQGWYRTTVLHAPLFSLHKGVGMLDPTAWSSVILGIPWARRLDKTSEIPKPSHYAHGPCPSVPHLRGF